MSIVIVGLATDGPVNQPVKISNLSDLRKLFGGNYIQRESVTPTQTLVNLDFVSQGPIYNTLGGRKDYLYNPIILSSGAVQFGAPGGASNLTLDLTYTPFLGVSDLITAMSWIHGNNASPVYVVRAGAVAATASSGNWLFESIYPGTRYNNLSIVASATGLVISGLEPQYPTCTYATTDSWSIEQQIAIDVDLGMCPVVLRTRGTNLGTFSIATSGGTDGVMNASTISSFLEGSTLPVDASHVFFLTEATSGVVSAIVDHTQDNPQPRMYYVNAPTVTLPVSGWINGLSSTLPTRHSLLSFMSGTVDIELDGEFRTRYAVEGLAQGMLRSGSGNCTNVSCSAVSTSPEFTAAQLAQLKSKGFMAMRVGIPNNVTVYEGVTSAADYSFLYSSKVAEISAVAYKFGYTQIGVIQPSGDKPELAKRLAALLDNIQYVTTEKVSINIASSVMYIEIVARIPNEILTIRFNIKNA